MSQLIPSNRNFIRRPTRARLRKQPSALSLRSPSSSNNKIPSSANLPTPSTSTTKFSTGPPSSSTLTVTPASYTNNSNSNSRTNKSNRRSTHSLRSLVPKKSSHSLSGKGKDGRGISPSQSISAPAPPPKLLRLSEILDPDDLIREHRSLSGTPAPGTPLTPHNPHDSFPGLQASSTAESSAAASVAGGEGKRLIIHSPSGAKLDAEAFAKRPDRPLTLGERQQRIREETARLADERRRVELGRAMREGRRGCCLVM
ncbi:MAG: hypothetical protein Q9166_007246 [cf. Caloplaca sp. 2 TL-2023]